MTTATAPMKTIAKPPGLDDLVERLGGISLSRILAEPAPATATDADVLEANRRYGRLYELIDGVLVEKVMAYRESLFALLVAKILLEFVDPRNLGLVSGPDGTMKLFGGLVRIPDVAFAAWDRIPGRAIPKEPIPDLTPDLVVEVLSESNTRAEMERKRTEYFAAGVRLIWEFDLDARIVTVYTRDGGAAVHGSSQSLEGGEVLPGFTLALGELFSKLDQHG
jgi:Uma2 family endonuclease